MTKSQGAKANESGKILEQQVTNALLIKGFTTIKHKDWIKLTSEQKKGRKLISDAPYTSIYASIGEKAGIKTRSSRSEFIISDDQTDTFCRVECKWQAVSGSVDEKLPYVYLNAIESWEEKEIIVLIDGKGWKQNAVNWLKDAVDGRRWREPSDNRNISVFNLGEFIQWAQYRFH
jgi:hypothetical protein